MTSQPLRMYLRQKVGLAVDLCVKDTKRCERCVPLGALSFRRHPSP
jgi:hypothetical protein